VTPVLIICGYLTLLLALGLVSNRFFRGTSRDYFVASHSIGPFMLLMSIFGTTMTAFALVGSTGKAFTTGIGVYGMMASWSGLIHCACFFFVGLKLWAIGKRYGYVTQVQFFRERFASPALGYVLFPALVLLLIPYLLIGVLGAGSVMKGLTAGTFVEVFPETGGAIPPWLTGLVVCSVVLTYVFWGGVRGAVWANTFQTLVFLTTAVAAFIMISRALGGLGAATRQTLATAPELLTRAGQIGHLEFFTYFLIPLSAGMFPHLFQHWLTARSARTFRLTLVGHPICMLILWVPCILIGVWAAGAGLQVAHPNHVLGAMVGELVHNEILTGLLIAGILAAIMSSLDSQFVCLGTMFTEDIVVHHFGQDRFTERQHVWLARTFIVTIVAVTYALSFFPPPHIFDLGIWCFSGFASLFPIAVAAVYWKRVTAPGAIAAVLVTAATWLILFTRNIALKQAGVGDEALILGMLPVAIIFTASVITLVIVSLLTRPPSRDTIRKFFPEPLEGMPT
jgi:SSS family solute:Na+ symporter